MADAMRPVKLAGKLPKGNADGLGTLHEQLVKGEGGFILLAVGTDFVKRRAGLPDEPTAFIIQSEGLPNGPLADAAKRLMGRARRARMEGDGADPLPRDHVDFGDEDDDEIDPERD